MVNRNLCTENKQFFKKNETPARIYLTSNNKIIKSIPVKTNKEYPMMKILQKLPNVKAKIFFVKVDEIKRCNKDNFYLLQKYENDIDINFLSSISKDNKINILKQILFAIFYLNNVLNIYHNDIYYKNSIRNVMYVKNELNDNSIIKHANLKVKCQDYIIKIIDFGWGGCKPGFRTTEYHKKYFPNNKIISEMLLFIYFYILELNQDENGFANNLCKILKKFSKLIEDELEKKMN